MRVRSFSLLRAHLQPALLRWHPVPTGNAAESGAHPRPPRLTLARGSVRLLTLQESFALHSSPLPAPTLNSTADVAGQSGDTVPSALGACLGAGPPPLHRCPRDKTDPSADPRVGRRAHWARQLGVVTAPAWPRWLGAVSVAQLRGLSRWLAVPGVNVDAGPRRRDGEARDVPSRPAGRPPGAVRGARGARRYAFTGPSCAPLVEEGSLPPSADPFQLCRVSRPQESPGARDCPGWGLQLFPEILGAVTSCSLRPPPPRVRLHFLGPVSWKRFTFQMPGY